MGNLFVVSFSFLFLPIEGMEVDGLTVEEAYFRGRKLQGATISLPEGYSGKLKILSVSSSLKIGSVC